MYNMYMYVHGTCTHTCMTFQFPLMHSQVLVRILFVCVGFLMFQDICYLLFCHSLMAMNHCTLYTSKEDLYCILYTNKEDLSTVYCTPAKRISTVYCTPAKRISTVYCTPARTSFRTLVNMLVLHELM